MARIAVGGWSAVEILRSRQPQNNDAQAREEIRSLDWSRFRPLRRRCLYMRTVRNRHWSVNRRWPARKPPGYPAARWQTRGEIPKSLEELSDIRVRRCSRRRSRHGSPRFRVTVHGRMRGGQFHFRGRSSRAIGQTALCTPQIGTAPCTNPKHREPFHKVLPCLRVEACIGWRPCRTTNGPSEGPRLTRRTGRLPHGCSRFSVNRYRLDVCRLPGELVRRRASALLVGI